MTDHALNDPALAAAFNQFDDDVRPHLLTLRSLIFETAAAISDCGEVVESLKWGQPSYATVRPKSGTPIRLGVPKSAPGCYAICVPCQTTQIDSIRLTHRNDFQYEGNRALFTRNSRSIYQTVIDRLQTLETPLWSCWKLLVIGHTKETGLKKTGLLFLYLRGKPQSLWQASLADRKVAAGDLDTDDIAGQNVDEGDHR